MNMSRHNDTKAIWTLILCLVALCLFAFAVVMALI